MPGVILFGLLITSPLFGADEDAGRALAQRLYDRPEGQDVSSRALMMLTEKGHRPRVREMFSYALDKGQGERWSMARFTKPADIEGTGLLTLDYPGDKSNQWLYLPALDRVRRISTSRKGGRFVGSDIFFEDLQDREVDMDHHRLAGYGKLGKIRCQILTGTPVDPDNSVYSKRVSWVHLQTLIPLRIDFYVKGETKPVKRMSVRKIKRIQGFWTVMDSTMHDLESGHKTRLLIKSIKYDQGLPDELFSRQGLTDDSHERKYRS